MQYLHEYVLSSRARRVMGSAMRAGVRPAPALAAGMLLLLSAVARPAGAQSSDEDLDFLVDEPKAQTAAAPGAGPESAAASDSKAESRSPEAPVAAKDAPGQPPAAAAPATAEAEPAAAPAQNSAAAGPEPYPEIIPVAQPAAPAVAPAAAPQRGRQIEEIVVTAQKRESSLQDAPLSISAIGGDDIAFRGVADASDLQFQVSGMNVSEGSNATLISIRGVGTNVDSGATEPGVAVHIDGVYQPRVFTGPLGLSDLDRVEVLRGPQGTLYGRNSTGGVVNYLLNKPSAEYEGALRAGVGSYGKRNVVGILSGPILADSLRGRVVGEWDQYGGHVLDLVSGKYSDDTKGYGGRVALSWLPAESFTVDLSVLFRHDEGAGIGMRDVTLAPPNAENELALGIFPTTQPDQYVVGDPHKRKLSFLASGERETTNGALTAVWEFDSFSLRSVTGYQDASFLVYSDFDMTSNGVVHLFPRNDQSHSISEELSIFGGGERLQWLLGAYLFKEKYVPDLNAHLPDAAGGAGLWAYLSDVEHTDAIAAFTDLTLSITDRIRLLGGLRALRDKKTAVWEVQYEVGDGALPTPLPTPGDFSAPGVIAECSGLRQEITSDKVTPKLGVQWDALDKLMAYGTWSLGYKSPGMNYSSCGNTYEAEEVTAYEVGIKANWLDRRIVTNLSAFTSDYENFQLLKIDGFAGIVINAPKARITGGELEVTAVVTDSLLVNGAVSVLDASYVEFSDDDPVYNGDNPQDLKGVELSRSPDYTVNLGADYTWTLPFSLAHALRLRLEGYKTADMVFRPFGHEHDGQKGYTLLNAFLSLSSADQGFSLRLFGKNLTDTEYYLYKFGDVFGERKGPGGYPRTFGAELSVRFH